MFRALKPLCIATAFALALPPVATADERATCRAEPSVTCLAELGFAAAMEAESLPAIDQSADLLATMGMLAEARVLVVKGATLNGSTQAEAEARADWQLGNYIATERLLSGEDPGVVKADIGLFKFQGAVFHLSGLMTSGTLLGPEATRDPERIAVIRNAVTHFDDDRSSQLSAASVLAELGEDGAARQVLDALPVDTSRGEHLPDNLIRLVGTARALEIYQSMGADLPWDWYYRTLALNEPDPARARVFLMQALDHIETMAPDMRPTKWRVVVRDAMEIGQGEVAELALRRLAESVAQDSTATAGHFMELADAQLVVNAPEAEVRDSLQEVERRIAAMENDTLKGDATEKVARLYLSFGDERAALRLFRSTGRDRRAWEWFVSNGKTREAREALLRAAESALSDDEMLSVRAYLAQSLSRDGRTDAEKREAAELARHLLSGAAPRDPVSQSFFFDILVRTGQQLGDAELTRSAMVRALDEAFESTAYRPLVQAAYRLYRAELN